MVKLPVLYHLQGLTVLVPYPVVLCCTYYSLHHFPSVPSVGLAVSSAIFMSCLQRLGVFRNNVGILHNTLGSTWSFCTLEGYADLACVATMSHGSFIMPDESTPVLNRDTSIPSWSTVVPSRALVVLCSGTVILADGAFLMYDGTFVPYTEFISYLPFSFYSGLVTVH